MGTHEGHRERLRTAYIDGGFESMSDYNTLELLLFYAIPRRDTNEIAHALLDRFGELDNVLNASIDELQSIDGIGRNAAVLINLIRPLSRKAAVLKSSNIRCISDSADLEAYLSPRFLHETEEIVIMLCLDSKNSIICCREVNRGVVNATDVCIRKIVETAIFNKASSVIIAHNHPGGFAIPSREDDMTTMQIKQALHTVGIRLADHMIIAENDYVSYADSRRL